MARFEFLQEVFTNGKKSDLIDGDFGDSQGQYFCLDFISSSGGEGGSSENSQQRGQIVDSIKLPMPRSGPYIYSVEYTADSTSSPLEQMLKEDNGILASLGSGFEAGKNKALQIASTTAARQVMKSEGFAHNTNKEFFFMQPSFRSFNYSWVLSSKNQNDAETLENIRRVIASNMLPEKSTRNAQGVWNIPSEARISFENANIPLIGPGVVNNLEFDPYGTGAGWKSFYDGRPVTISMSITFLETEPLHRDLVRRGR